MCGSRSRWGVRAAGSWSSLGLALCFHGITAVFGGEARCFNGMRANPSWDAELRRSSVFASLPLFLRN